MVQIPDHPQIQWIERTGYPSWMQEDDSDEDDCEEVSNEGFEPV